MLAIAVYQHQMYWLKHRYREQVESSHRRSHILDGVNKPGPYMNISAARWRICSSVNSSIWVARNHTCPNGSFNVPERSP